MGCKFELFYWLYMANFIKRTRIRTRIFKKSGPRAFRKSGPYTKNHFWQIWGCWFQVWQYFFKILAQKYSNKAFLVQNLAIFVSLQNFAIEQSWECWLHMWQYFFNILAQKYPNKAFFAPNLGIFCCVAKFCSLTNWRVLIWNMTIVF